MCKIFVLIEVFDSWEVVKKKPVPENRDGLSKKTC